MIHCPQCQIGFSPSYEQCPKCGQYSTPRGDRLKYFGNKSEEYAEKNISLSNIRSYLIENGLSDLEADRVLSTAVGEVRRRNRSHGVLRLLAGMGMLLLGGSLLGATALSAGGRAAQLGASGSLRAVLIGASFMGCGLVLSLRSLWMMLSGR